MRGTGARAREGGTGWTPRWCWRAQQAKGCARMRREPNPACPPAQTTRPSSSLPHALVGSSSASQSPTRPEWKPDVPHALRMPNKPTAKPTARETASLTSSDVIPGARPTLVYGPKLTPSPSLRRTRNGPGAAATAGASCVAMRPVTAPRTERRAARMPPGDPGRGCVPREVGEGAAGSASALTGDRGGLSPVGHGSRVRL